MHEEKIFSSLFIINKLLTTNPLTSNEIINYQCKSKISNAVTKTEAIRFKFTTYITYPFLLGNLKTENKRIEEKINPINIIILSVNSFT